MQKKITRSVPFAKPHFNDEDLKQIMTNMKKVLRSGWLTSGPIVKEFETEFSGFIGSRYAVAFNSCTAALHSILLALDIGEGDEVIVPSNTFVATANAALYVGAKPIFADCDIETFNISPDEIIEKVSRKTKAIIVVHLGGNPCDMSEIREIGGDHNIPVIEDSAHAHGAKYKGDPCGTLGIAGAFSFYPTKIMTTAEGGMVATDQKDLADRLCIIRNHGRAAFGPAEIVELGFNYRLSDIHAILGLTQIKHIDEFIKHRNMIAHFYNEELSEIKCIKTQLVREGNTSSYYSYIIRLTKDAPLSRDELVKKLDEWEIGTSVLYHPIHTQPLYRKLFGYEKGFLPVTEELGDRSLGLPMYNNISKNDALYVIKSFKEIFDDKGALT